MQQKKEFNLQETVVLVVQSTKCGRWCSGSHVKQSEAGPARVAAAAVDVMRRAKQTVEIRLWKANAVKVGLSTARLLVIWEYLN